MANSTRSDSQLELEEIAQTNGSFVKQHNGGDYLVTLCYKYGAARTLDEIRPKLEKVAWHKVIWFKYPRHPIIAWIVQASYLSTPTVCLVIVQLESRDYLFITCDLTKQI